MSIVTTSPSRTIASGPPRAASGSDVTDHQPSRGAGEAPVGDERDRLTEPCTDDERGPRSASPACQALRPGLRTGRRARRRPARAPTGRLRCTPPRCRTPAQGRVRAAFRTGELDEGPPSGARLPRSACSAPLGLNGRSSGRSTSPSGSAALAVVSASVGPRHGRRRAVDVTASHQLANQRGGAARPVEVLRHETARTAPGSQAPACGARRRPDPRATAVCRPRGRSRAGAGSRSSSRRSR